MGRIVKAGVTILGRGFFHFGLDNQTAWVLDVGMTTATPALDFIASGDFSSTVTTVTPATEKGRNFFREMFGCAGVAPVSIEMPKTKFSDFVIFATRKGYTVA